MFFYPYSGDSCPHLWFVFTPVFGIVLGDNKKKPFARSASDFKSTINTYKWKI